MAGLIKVNAVQLGDSATDSQNFLFKTNVDGTAKLSRGAGGNLGDILTVDATGKVTLTNGYPSVSASALPSMVRLNTANGYGSTNTMIRRFTNVVTNQGTDITYADSATLGASFTINTAGVYAISYSDCFSVASSTGVSVDSTQLTSTITSINTSNVLCLATSASATYIISVAFTGYFPSGAVIRAHTSAANSGNTPGQFTITRVA